jgi:hypothetical protein
MALVLTLSSSNADITQLTLTDTTGVYAAGTNPGGWGAPNLALTAVLYAHLLIDTPEGGSYDIDIISDLGIDFATVASDELIYNITHDLLGGTVDTTLEDGTYAITYRISDNATWDNGGTDYEITLNAMTYYVVQGQVFERIAEIPTYYTCASCDNMYVKETTTLFMLLQSAIAAANYSTTTQFELILAMLEDALSFDASLDEDCGC